MGVDLVGSPKAWRRKLSNLRSWSRPADSVQVSGEPFVGEVCSGPGTVLWEARCYA